MGSTKDRPRTCMQGTVLGAGAVWGGSAKDGSSQVRPRQHSFLHVCRSRDSISFRLSPRYKPLIFFHPCTMLVLSETLFASSFPLPWSRVEAKCPGFCPLRFSICSAPSALPSDAMTQARVLFRVRKQAHCYSSAKGNIHSMVFWP